MTTLTADQMLALDLAAKANRRLRDAKLTLEAEVRAEIRARSLRLVEANNDAVLTCHELGIPKTQIGILAMHTRSIGAVRDAIAEATARRAARTGVIEPRFRIGSTPNEVLVTLSGADLARSCRENSWPVDEALAAGVDQAVFKVVDPRAGGGLVIVAVTPSFVEEFQRPQPAVAWGRAHIAAALDWWKGQVA